MGGTAVQVSGWGELDGLVAAMGEVGEQWAQTTAYAVTWMCRPDGFATSPVCLLRPLAAVLDLVAAAFTDAAQLWGDDWRRLRDGAEEAARQLRASDAAAAARFVVATKAA